MVKRRFFAMRNGAVAASLRAMGAPYRIIFGLQLPQIAEIARDFAPDAELAAQLWANTSTRESMLMAPMLFEVGGVPPDTAMELATSATTAEVADILCLKLLSRLPFAWSMVEALRDSEADMSRYVAIRLAFNLINQRPAEALAVADAEMTLNCALTALTARMLADEARFLLE